MFPSEPLKSVELLSNLKWKFSFHSKTVWVLFSVLLWVSYVSSASLFVFSFFPFLSVSHTLMASVTSVCGPAVSQTDWASWLNRYSDACVLVMSESQSGSAVLLCNECTPFERVFIWNRSNETFFSKDVRFYSQWPLVAVPNLFLKQARKGVITMIKITTGVAVSVTEPQRCYRITRECHYKDIIAVLQHCSLELMSKCPHFKYF